MPVRGWHQWRHCRVGHSAVLQFYLPSSGVPHQQQRRKCCGGRGAACRGKKDENTKRALCFPALPSSPKGLLAHRSGVLLLAGLPGVPEAVALGPFLHRRLRGRAESQSKTRARWHVMRKCSTCPDSACGYSRSMSG